MTIDAPGPDDSAAIAPSASSLRRGAIAVLLGNGVFNACRIGVIVLLAKFAGESVLGEFNYAMALSAPIVIFAALELRSVFVADPHDQIPFGAYLALRTIGMWVSAGVLLLATLPALLSEPGAAWWIILVGGCMAKVLLHQADIYWGVYQKRERLDLLGWSNALRGVSMLAAFGTLVPAARWLSGEAQRESAVAAAAAAATVLQFVAWWAITRLLDRRFAREQVEARPDWHAPQLGRLALMALPLAVAVGLVSLADNLPFMLIRQQDGGRSALGFFGALAYVPMAAQFIIVQIGNAATHRLAVGYHHDFPRFLRLCGLLVGGSILVGAAAFAATWLIGRQLLGVLYAPQYAEFFPAFLIIVLGQCVLLPGAILGFIVTQMRLFWGQVPLQAATLLVTAVAAFWLITPSDPIGGAAWTLLIRGVSQTLLYAGAALVAVRARAAAEERARA